MKCPDRSLKFIALLIFLLVHAGLSGQKEELSLQQAIGMTLDHHYGIIMASYDTDISRINNNWGTAGRYPSISVDAGLSDKKQIDGGDNARQQSLSTGVGLDWVLFNGFKVAISKEKLEQLQAQSEGNAAVVIEGAIEEVVLSYYLVLLQQEKEAVLGRILALSEDRYTYEQAKYELGGSSTYKVLQAKNVFLGDKAAYLSQQVEVRNAIRDINFLTGEAPATEWIFTDTFDPDTSAYIFDELLEKTLKNNQRLKNQYISLQLQENAYRLAKSDLMPSLRLSAGLDKSLTGRTVYPDPIEIGNVFTPSIALSFTYDLYKGGTKKRAIDIARIDREIVSVEREEMIHTLTNTLYSEYDLYLVRKVLLDVTDEALKTADLNLELSEEKYRSGSLSSLEYRDVQLLYLEAALQRLQAVYNLINSNITLSRITGGILDYAEEGDTQ